MSTFYRTIIEIEVVSKDEPYELDDLMQLACDIDNPGQDSDVAGKWRVVRTEEIPGQEAARMIKACGDDPEFFGLDEQGYELNDEDDDCDDEDEEWEDEEDDG